MLDRSKILNMAREAGGTDKTSLGVVQFFIYELERFAVLVSEHTLLNQKARHYQEGYEAGRRDENEACAKVCDEKERANLYGVRECAAAIRARREQ